MTSTWQTKKLSEICDFQNGFAFKSGTFKNEGLPILRISNIQNDGISYKRLVFFDKKNYKENFDKYEVNKGDLVIAMSGATTGKLAINNTDEIFYLNQRVGKFIPKKDLSKDYLYYFLSTKIEENLHISSGAAQPNLSTEQINNFKIPFPSLSDQQRIVKILDETFEKIEKVKQNAEKNLQNSKEIFELYIKKVFKNKNNWEKKKLGQITNVQSGGTPSRANPNYWNGVIPWYSSGELNDIFTKNSERLINNLAINSSNAKLFPKGSLLIGMYDTAALKMSILDRDAAFNQAIAGVKPDENINLVFVLYYINSMKFQLLELRRGVRQKNLSLEKIKNIEIFIPSIKEQNLIVNKINSLQEKTKKLESIYQQKLSDLEELKKSILNKAFNGEL